LIEKSPQIEEWRNLYKSIVELKDISPWEWLEESDLFAIQSPETNEIGFVSVMGMIGEHYAISVYLGEKGLYGFWNLQQSAPDMISHQMLLEIPQLQASFENRTFLHSKDRDLIKTLGFTFRGKQSWPMFRSYRPGFFPWFLNSDEARFLRSVLDQTIDVSLRAKKDRSLLRFGRDDNYLLRKGIRKEGKLVWQDSRLKVLPPAPCQIEISVNMLAVENLRKIAPGSITLEIDLFMSTEPVKEKDMRPYYPYILMLIDADSGMTVGAQILQPLPTLETMWGTVTSEVIEVLVRLQLRPQKILVNSELLYQLLSYVDEKLDIPVELAAELPNISHARASLFEFYKNMK
jgi:hypothetical protein